jgi:hypothetical protein
MYIEKVVAIGKKRGMKHSQWRMEGDVSLTIRNDGFCGRLGRRMDKIGFLCLKLETWQAIVRECGKKSRSEELR